MKKVITYGTFDLFHYGHRNLLARAKELGDYLIVGVTSDNYDIERGKLNVQNSVLERIESVRATGLADEIIVEEYEGQKIHDIQSMDVDIFAIGSDWVGKFDYLREFCDVVYLERTQGVSSTELRQAGTGPVHLGVLGTSHSCAAFVRESRFVSGSEVLGVFDADSERGEGFRETNELDFHTQDAEDLFAKVDAVYVGVPLAERESCVRAALESGTHVLCEPPMATSVAGVESLYALAKEKDLVLLDGVGTAYSPGFKHLPALAKSGRIGDLLAVDVAISAAGSRTFGGRYANPDPIETLASYPLVAIAKLLGKSPESVSFHKAGSSNGKQLVRCSLQYSNATASVVVSPDVPTDAALVVTGSRGYIHVPEPWWKTSYFEVRHPGQDDVRRYFYAFDGEGIRYELHELVKMVRSERRSSQYVTSEESLFVSKMLEEYSAS